MNLIPQRDIDNATGIYRSFFYDMSIGRNSYVTVYKEPIQIINNPTNDNVLPGYNSDAINSDITYQAVSGIYPCVPIYPYKNINSDKLMQLKFVLDANQVVIKVLQDARDFIVNGKNEKVIVDNLPYTILMDYQVQNFWGDRYYYFKLNAIQ